MGIQRGAFFPTRDMPADRVVLRDWAQAAEELGFDFVEVPDHVLGADRAALPDFEGPYDIDDSFHELFVTLGFIAGATNHIGLASGVLILPQRQTALVAKQAAQLDILCGGRLRLGVGVGWNPVEYAALGQQWSTRGRRQSEQLELMNALWTERTVSFEGEFDVIAHAGHLPAIVTIGRDEHGEVGLATGAGEGGGHVAFLACRGLQAQDQHVLGHPAVLLGDGRGDTQGQTLLAEEGVAAVSGTVGLDLLGLGEVHDVFLVVAWPGDVLLALLKGGAHRVEAGNKGAVSIATEIDGAGGLVLKTLQHFVTDLGHDPHVDHHVGAVGNLNPDLGKGGVKGAHAERDDIHGAALHAPGEKALELLAHLGGISPVVGWSRIPFLRGADEGAVLHAGHVTRTRAGQEAVGAFLGIEPGEGSGIDEELGQFVPLSL